MYVKNPLRRKFLQTAAFLGAATVLAPLLHGCGGGGGGSGSGSGSGVTLAGLRAIDAHAHPDHFYGPNQVPPDNSSTLDAIRNVAMAASSFAAVGDLIFRTTGNAGGDEYTSSLNQLNRVVNLANQGKVKIIRTTADIPQESSATVTPGAILTIEGGDALMGDPEKLLDFYNLGVRILTLVHYRDNQLGDSVGVTNGGLTTIGIQAVVKMESLGIVVDVAHSSSQTLTDVCSHAHKPIIDSHTGLNTANTPSATSRLRTMAEMELVASTGGLVCLWPLAVDTRLTIADWATEIKTIKTNIGIEYIALGTDGGGRLPTMVSGYQSVADLPKLADAMRSAGLSENDIKAFFGGNMLRILGQCIG
jgi:membrane dipeptidase